MLTYVINTSENRTLDSDRLFDLAGYNKIRWMNCRLDEVDSCAQYIYEKQNVLGADRFRIAVLVDFFNFDRIRTPYGRKGYRPDEGVDISVYMPYIEIYLMDNLVNYLENRELHPFDFEVYYIQNSKLERYDFLNNSLFQLRQVLSGDPLPEELSYLQDEADKQRLEAEQRIRDFECSVEEPKKKKRRSKDSEDEIPEDEKPIEQDSLPVLPDDNFVHPSFTLYCTKNVSLNFNLVDYPYGAEALTLPEFAKLFNDRAGKKYELRRHYYISSYGGGYARAAFDTLSLSLHLIHVYEREETPGDDMELEINRIDPEKLKDVLVNAWNKVCLARNVSKGNNSVYYSLRDNLHIDDESLKAKEGATMAELLTFQNSQEKENLSSEQLYKKVCYYSNRSEEQLAADNRAEFDRLMNEYLRHRDDTKEIDITLDLETKIRENSLVTTSQFPSEEDYLHLVAEKEQEISEKFDSVLSSTIREMDYSEEKKRADIAFEKYTRAKAFTSKSIIGDIVFLILTMLSFVGPYYALQLTNSHVGSAEAGILALQCLGLFGSVFVGALLIQIIVLSIIMGKAKKELRACYADCFDKECESLSQIRKRFREDLLYIERARYELRQLRQLYEMNLAKDENIKCHRNLLEDLEDKLGSMLNSLDVDPVLDPDDTVSGEFDITKPIKARENKVYRIFSLETIEKLFIRKGRDVQ